MGMDLSDPWEISADGGRKEGYSYISEQKNDWEEGIFTSP